MIAAAALVVATITGVVRDSGGGAVAGASVIARVATASPTSSGSPGSPASPASPGSSGSSGGSAASGAEQQTTTGADGRFTIVLPEGGEIVIIVRASGFAEAERRLSGRPGAPGGASGLEIVLAPAALFETVTVTASRGASSADTPAATMVLTNVALESTAAPMLDDQLKSVAGFSLFRRSSSRVANPTTQGVTMRGLSASGASRSLVLVDGVPLNDAFGGWVYWDRVPQTALDRVEIVRGGTSDLYGADAVGGVIQVLTLAPTKLAIRASSEIASRSTPRLSLFGGGSHGAWSTFASGEWQRSDGYVIIAPEQRGPVDTPASSSYRTAYANVAFQGRDWRASVRGHAFREARENGTPLTPNNTASRGLVGELSGTVAGGLWLVRAYGGTQGYDQGFSSVNAARTAESLTQLQHVPSKNGGGTAQWTMWTGRTTWTLGTNVRRVEGRSEERAFSAGRQTGFSALGGIQWAAGGFGRAEVAVSDRFTVDGSLGIDRWSSDPNTAALTPRSAVAVDPKIGAKWRASEHIALHAVATRAFRAPTLNELFRNFRVGNTVTTANDKLAPEVLTGVESGVTITRGAASLRVIGFLNHLTDAVTNVTIAQTPTLITRQRRNAGIIRAAGAEVEGEWQIVPAVRATVGLELVDSVFAESQEPGLTGNRVPQVPRAQGSAGLRFTAPAGLLATMQFRFNSAQFDDDRNQFLLGRATVLDALASKALGHGVQLFGAIENVFNSEYDVGRTPTRTVGLPRTWRAGIRAYLP
jgi:outer membrane cobalamin receptor